MGNIQLIQIKMLYFIIRISFPVSIHKLFSDS